MDLPSVAEGAERPCISTGHLPVHEIVQKPAPVGNFKSDTNEKNHREPPPAVPNCVPSTVGK
jgi:hypothetical protein